MKIYVSIHPESSEDAFTLLDDFSRQAQDRGVEIVISTTTSHAGST